MFLWCTTHCSFFVVNNLCLAIMVIIRVCLDHCSLLCIFVAGRLGVERRSCPLYVEIVASTSSL